MKIEQESIYADSPSVPSSQIFGERKRALAKETCLPVGSSGSSLLRALEVELAFRNWLLAVSRSLKKQSLGEASPMPAGLYSSPIDRDPIPSLGRHVKVLSSVDCAVGLVIRKPIYLSFGGKMFLTVLFYCVVRSCYQLSYGQWIILSR